MTGDRRALASAATDAASALLGRLVELGVSDLVLSPGSRSQSLALVAAEFERRGVLHVHVRIDERVAGFTALGIARESGMPAAVVCTSGTAVANLLPAALEAHHSGVPLLLLTADRPPELRGVGANQTTRQPGLFAAAVRYEADLPVPDDVDPVGDSEQSAMLRIVAHDAIAAALGAGLRSPGPVHLNLPYREPLAGALPDWLGMPAAELSVTTTDADPVGPPVDEVVEDESSGALYQGGGGIGESDVPPGCDDEPYVLERGPRTVVIAGAGAGADAEETAHLGAWPLIAEVVSGARYGRNLVHGYRTLLRDPELGGRIERAVVFGHPTLSREVTALLTDPGVEVVALRGPGEPLNLNGATVPVEKVRVASGDGDRGWIGAWWAASRAASVDLTPPAPDADALSSAVPDERLGAIATELAVIRAPLDRKTLVDAVWRATWPHDRLMFGSSSLVRVADAVLPGKKVPVHANRGLAGIDGTVATAIGVAVASQSRGAPGVTRVILGDLALLHDVGALLLPPQETQPRIQVVVGNDGGGTIFDGLEVAQVAASDDLDRVMYTPQSVRIEQLALAYGWEYQRVTTRSALDQALTSPVGGCQIIEVPLER
ncbi:2-succinyl-5-enolpyruvyl-6-hydroxy-3-cyclohexene-1-carboxylate synthase [Microbacterium terrae]|uniref:2-succinyl-5-enolpyruvyl-6-hydroxy-3-cyclohexene-1-carboxylate synthase n=1 Tax=Microbacterium terrae TaxID=69369 RepID=A0A0M2GUV8_9MICO|nr:2-succinyl-5-enolpyruvyl-6-hydroxy-3-cyclohexene-1-carboxylic-acid synthase [Microbacterium terrae]KJL37466.1 2-succinyl-5-enolpyruvyl-6-hydroxy-3-cyclohexene-1-carboxylate synthase [Microbacterium terrae]MBP1076295.1 2-succinyl-5-enolpyruvyl-6-hydroxy-3-cyclohexene-1-carboxylate synthase [Microbacterium terrae]GLJ97117.1 2-succinyl-5-enolpyruvyl-6-hydroxy-3-cyclohexene- 1-carboxylate synthase [Microbacterium terrae]